MNIFHSEEVDFQLINQPKKTNQSTDQQTNMTAIKPASNKLNHLSGHLLITVVCQHVHHGEEIDLLVLTCYALNQTDIDLGTICMWLL